MRVFIQIGVLDAGKLSMGAMITRKLGRHFIAFLAMGIIAYAVSM
jgi:hypothetical protein